MKSRSTFGRSGFRRRKCVLLCSRTIDLPRLCLVPPLCGAPLTLLTSSNIGSRFCLPTLLRLLGASWLLLNKPPYLRKVLESISCLPASGTAFGQICPVLGRLFTILLHASHVAFRQRVVLAPSTLSLTLRLLNMFTVTLPARSLTSRSKKVLKVRVSRSPPTSPSFATPPTLPWSSS
jgi:hypothetical protein